MTDADMAMKMDPIYNEICTGLKMINYFLTHLLERGLN